jgi:hypothetical protein
LKSAAKFIIINAVTYGPAGVTGWAVKSVARARFITRFSNGSSAIASKRRNGRRATDFTAQPVTPCKLNLSR